MGERIQYGSKDGITGAGYLAQGPQGSPGVIVIQEWWGLVPQIERTCDRLAQAGFTALAPDLYGGVQVPLDEPDEAAKNMMALKLETAATELSGAVDELVARTGRAKVGVIGFCMGGGLALVLGATRPDAIAAVVPCYGVLPWPDAHPDYAQYTAAVQIHCAQLDGSFPPDAAQGLTTTLEDLGKIVELHVYEGADHAFANEDRPGVYDEAAAGLLMNRAVAFFTTHL